MPLFQALQFTQGAILHQHESYSSNLLRNDIAIIELKKSVNTNLHKPIPMSASSSELEKDKAAFVIGFGMVNSSGGVKDLLQ